jgi:hypothetical protein
MTGLFTLSGVGVAGYLEGRRERRSRKFQEAESLKADSRSLRNAKVERLRSEYAELLRAGRMLEQVAVAAGTLTVPETQQVIDGRLRSILEALERSIAALLLESEGPEVLGLFEKVQATFNRYVEGREMTARNVAEQGYGSYFHGLEADLQEIGTGVAKLAAAGREQIAALEQPI